MICLVIRSSISSIEAALTSVGNDAATALGEGPSGKEASAVRVGTHASAALLADFVCLLLGGPLRRLLGQPGRRVQLAVGADATRQIGNLPRFDQLATDLGNELAADGQLFRHAAIGPVMMQLELDLDGPTAFGAGQWQSVEQVDAGHEVECIGERAFANLGPDRPFAEQHRRGMAVEPVGHEQAVVDAEHDDRRQAIPRVGIALDGKLIEAIAEVQVLIENEVVEWYLVDLHWSGSFVVGDKAQGQRCSQRDSVGLTSAVVRGGFHQLFEKLKSEDGADDHADSRDRSKRATGFVSRG
jgi:hypothetical protein